MYDVVDAKESFAVKGNPEIGIGIAPLHSPASAKPRVTTIYFKTSRASSCYATEKDIWTGGILLYILRFRRLISLLPDVE